MRICVILPHFRVPWCLERGVRRRPRDDIAVIPHGRSALARPGLDHRLLTRNHGYLVSPRCSDRRHVPAAPEIGRPW